MAIYDNTTARFLEDLAAMKRARDLARAIDRAERSAETRRRNRATMGEMIAAVRAHARDHYGDGDGWDIVVEVYDDDDVRLYIGRATTRAGAIRNVGRVVSMVADVRRDREGWANDA